MPGFLLSLPLGSKPRIQNVLIYFTTPSGAGAQNYLYTQMIKYYCEFYNFKLRVIAVNGGQALGMTWRLFSITLCNYHIIL